jgi:hypothetical protein
MGWSRSTFLHFGGSKEKNLRTFGLARHLGNSLRNKVKSVVNGRKRMIIPDEGSDRC